MPVPGAPQEVHVDLGVGVVAQQRGVGEDEDDDRREVLGPVPQDRADRRGGQGRGGVLGGLRVHRGQGPGAPGGVDPRQQHDEGGGGAHDDGVDEHAQGLDEPLLD